MRSIMDDATKLAHEAENCVKQAWNNAEKTATYAWHHPKQDALRVFNDGTRVLHDFDSGLVDGAVSTVKSAAHAAASISQDIYHGAETTFTDPGQAWRNVEYDTAGIRTHISSVAQQAEQGVVTWSNHPTQAWHNVEINTANDAYKVANYASKEAHSLVSMNAYQIGEAVGSGVVIALPAIMTGGATAEAEAAGSVFEAAAVETSGETASQVGFFGRGAGGFTRSLGAEAVESSQVATRSEQLAVRDGVFGGGGEEPLLFKTGGLSAEEANAPFIEEGKRPPYAIGTRARIIQLQREGVLMRVHGEGNQARSWMMRAKEVEGLTAQQIKDKFALPELPTHISEVHLPSGSYLQVGTTSSQIGWGAGGPLQYQALDWLDPELFQNPLPIEEYQNQFLWRHHHE